MRPWLIQLKLLGLLGFLGGLMSLTAMTLLGPVPETAEGWQVLRESMRSVFFPCVFAGVGVTILAGLLLFLRHPKHFSRMRWFRLKVALLVVLIPGLHFWSRGRVLAFYAALDEGRLNEAPELWQRVGVAFAVALVTMLCVASLGRYKPRLGG